MEKVIKLLAKYYPVYLSGLWGTLWISAVTVLSGALLGMLVALMRMSRSKLLNGIAGAYVEILRGTPILLQLGDHPGRYRRRGQRTVGGRQKHWPVRVAYDDTCDPAPGGKKYSASPVQ